MHRSGVLSRTYDKGPLDHHWGSVKEKTPFNYVVHKILHLTNPHHRSWQTHSLLVTGSFCFLLWAIINLCSSMYGNTTTILLLRLMVVGLAVGIASHLVLDAFTTAGIHTIPGKKLRLVPRHSAFATGTVWEGIVMKLLCLGIFLMSSYIMYSVLVK